MTKEPDMKVSQEIIETLDLENIGAAKALLSFLKENNWTIEDLVNAPQLDPDKEDYKEIALGVIVPKLNHHLTILYRIATDKSAAQIGTVYGENETLSRQEIGIISESIILTITRLAHYLNNNNNNNDDDDMDICESKNAFAKFESQPNHSLREGVNQLKEFLDEQGMSVEQFTELPDFNKIPNTDMDIDIVKLECEARTSNCENSYFITFAMTKDNKYTDISLRFSDPKDGTLFNTEVGFSIAHEMIEGVKKYKTLH